MISTPIFGVLIVVILTVYQAQGQVQQQQYFKVWVTEGCSGNPDLEISDSANFTLPANVTTLHARPNGLWATQTCNSTYCSGRTFRHGFNGEGCEPVYADDSASTLVMERYGDLNQSEPKIYFYPQSALRGTPLIITEDGETDLNFLTQSHLFTGAFDWFVKDAMGSTNCFDADEAVDNNGYGVTFSLFTGNTVTDVKFGCSETTTSPTTVQTPGSSSGTSTTWDPEIISCVNRPDGMYPHPYDCAMFIGCQNEVATVYTCPPPMLFDPVQGGCELPQLVDCSLTCVDMEDGKYPHPHDCSLFISCYQGNLEIFRCPPPLLFDPNRKNCYFPDEVDCNAY